MSRIESDPEFQRMLAEFDAQLVTDRNAALDAAFEASARGFAELPTERLEPYQQDLLADKIAEDLVELDALRRELQGMTLPQCSEQE